MKKELFLLLLVVSAVACNNSAKEQDKQAITDSTTTVPAANTDTPKAYIHTFKDTTLEDKITTALLKLPFVKKSDKYIDSISNHKHGIAFMLDEPAKDETDIPVQAGYNGKERFETYYRFFVNPKTLEIKVYDVVEDKKLTLKDYLKTQQ
jgi:hypothetical protein